MSSRGSRSTGMLSASSAPTSVSRGGEKTSSKSRAAKSSAPALKVVVRRLPPGLTQAEFESVLGDEWKIGGPWVDWYSYKPGKATKGIAKPSRPGRAYFHLTDQNKVTVLHEKIKLSQFYDAANTHRDPVLAGPPYLQYAPFAKIPKRNRKDKRQGMIDQDPDFIAFLESLTDPVQKTPAGTWTEELKEEIPVVTPLIQYLKEKKAKQSKAKESPSKAGKVPAREVKDSRADKNKKVLTRADREGDKRDKSMPVSAQASEKGKEKPAKELSKPAKGHRAPAAPESSVSSSKDKAVKDQKQKERAPPTAPAADRKKDKGKTIVNPQILRREPSAEQPKETAKLPRALKEPRESRDTRESRQSKEAKGKPDAGQDRSKTEKGSNGAAAPPTGPSGNVVPPTEPSAKPPKAPRNRRERIRDRGKSKAEESTAATPPSGPKASTMSESGTPATQQPPTKPAAATTSKATAAAAKQAQSTLQTQPAHTATQAFLKHANPSQGVTEENLFSGFSVFGKVLKTEIDKKKGFAYVYFADPEGLKKAIKASPVQIAQSKVVVAERKSAPQIAVSRGRGGSASRNSGAGGVSAAQQGPPAQPQGQAHQQNQDRPPAQGQTQVQSQGTQPAKQPPTAPAAERAASNGAPNGNGKAPPMGPRGGRPRHHRGPRGGNKGANKGSGSAGGSSAAASSAA